MPAKKESDQSPVKKGARKAKSADDKPKVKRAPSAYIVFCTEKRTEAKESNPDATFGELGKILGLMWGQLDDKGKEVRDPWRIPIVVYRPILDLDLTPVRPKFLFNPTIQPYSKISAAKKAALEEA
jgi:HMG (high mobility group) box